ncbi:MAG TPA: pyruvate dehydrogenase (acetyl-transferring), homodimeric type [Planctomycetaceae bacterium]
MAQDTLIGSASGIDPEEIRDWYESLEDILYRYGSKEAGALLKQLESYARRRGVDVPFEATTDYVNTIPPEDQPEYPGDLALERRIKSIIRWNAAAMVVRANKGDTGVGGHISTYASSATLYEVGYNHFFRGRGADGLGDMVYFQGHAAPGMYARAFVEGRLDEGHLEKFRREIPRGAGLSSYPHPWLMPDFWQFPTVSMGLGPITSLYHARFLRYLQNRGLKDTSGSTVWCFLGDGEMDEPESLGAITLPVRENLDNVIWVVNCNLQRLDGPVRGNGKIVQELEGVFRGAGWNVIKVLWGTGWDPLFARDREGKLVRRMNEVIDGELQKYVVEGGAYVREHFFGTDPDLLDLVADMSDEEISKLRRGGHDAEKVYAAYSKAKRLKNGRPTVILAQTIKGWGLGAAGEGQNVAHNTKKMTEDQLRAFRDRFEIPVKDEDLAKAPFYRPEPGSPEYEYIHAHREKLGGFVPSRVPTDERLTVPPLETFKRFLEGTGPDKTASTTFVLGQLISKLLKDKNLGERVVPIIPDEARTFGMESLFAQVGIYAPHGQLYEPVDRKVALYYREAQDGQLLEEGINEAGAMSSFVAAGTAYSNVGLHMIPFYIYYSMFGFQRVGDLIWLAGDSRTRGFLCGGTSGRTTLNGEGLQHEDGHSQVIASTVPNLVAYDPAYGYELTVIVQDGLRRMYAENEDVFYYLSVYNEAYYLPPMPEDPDGKVREGILKGLYLFKSSPESKAKVRPQLFGSGTILNEVVRAQQILEEKYGIGSDVWSATSYNELARDARATARWNRLHPNEAPKRSHLETALAGRTGPFVSSSDNIRAWADQVREWIPGRYIVLGTDGFGRSATRGELRRHFEVDAESVVYATLRALADEGHYDAKKLPDDLKALGLDPDKVDPMGA